MSTTPTAFNTQGSKPKLVFVGNGMAGTRTLEELLLPALTTMSALRRLSIVSLRNRWTEAGRNRLRDFCESRGIELALKP